MALFFVGVQRALLIGTALLLSCSLFAQSSNSTWTNGNRLVYLDESDPFYPGPKFPKLTTPQWIGEPGVDAAVVFAIDDMREPPKYETYIRPIVDRLKQIDGRAHFSIMTIAIKSDDPELQPSLKEGVSLEVHTLTHPFPLLSNSNFQAAADTYFGCIDLLNRIAGNKPVAFRMPYCDSLDTPSPRFYAELFNSTNAAGQFLSIDSSVMNIFTSADPELPRPLVMQANGKERFRKYIPFPSFVTTIENYPYPYVIGKLCWEFPATVPSDWEAKNFHGTNNPVTVADWEAALDATVLKQGVFTFIFHPHGWIRPSQMVEFIDYAVGKYGKRVKFLNFHEALDRINAHLLAGNPLRSATGRDNGVRLLDLNNDGYLDIVIGNGRLRRTRVWQSKTRTWRDSNLPVTFITRDGPTGPAADTRVQFGIIGPAQQVVMLTAQQSGKAENGQSAAGDVSLSPRERAGVRGNSASELRLAYLFSNNSWIAETNLLRGLQINGQPLATSIAGRDRGVRFRDLDNDGQCELIVGNETQSVVFKWSAPERTWK